MNLTKHQRPDIDKIYLYVKDLFKSEYWFLINEREKVGIEISKSWKTFVYYLQTIDGVLENLEDYHPTNKRRVIGDISTFNQTFNITSTNKSWKQLMQIKKWNQTTTVFFVST